MTNEQSCVNCTCILRQYRTAPCESYCGHKIALTGLTGDGGRIANAGLPKDYRNLTIATSPAREGQAKVYALLERYVATFGSGEVKSLYLWSQSPGTGKTSTASALITEWIIRDYMSAIKEGRTPSQVPAYFLDVNEWQELYNGFNRKNIPQDVAEKNSRAFYRQMERTKKAPFAVLDDLGVRDATPGFRGDLHSIINHRVTNGLPTIYTSNLALSDMESVFDARLYDRIKDKTGEIFFEGKSNRGRR